MQLPVTAVFRLDAMRGNALYAARGIVRWHVEKRGGRITQLAGDSVSAVFAKKVEAARGVCEAQEGLEAYFGLALACGDAMHPS